MKNLLLYEGFLRKALNVNEGVFKIIFNDYYAIANLDTYFETTSEEDCDIYSIDSVSYLDYLILNIIEKVRKDNVYKIVNKNNIKINNRILKLDTVTYKYNDEFSEDDKDFFVYRLRSKEDAIETFKKIDNILNLETFIMNNKKMKKDIKIKVVNFISDNIRDIRYIINAENFGLI